MFQPPRPQPKPKMQGQETDRLKMLRARLDGPVYTPGKVAPFAGGPQAQQTDKRDPIRMPGRGASGIPAPGTGAPTTNPVPAQPPQAAPAPAATQTPPPAPPKPLTEEESAQQLQDFIDKMIGGAGKVDTSADEALIRELGLDAQGQALVDQRASMGRAGFGASGALSAMEGDIRRKQSQSDQGAILDLRRDEDQRAKDNALAAIGADADLRSAAADEFLMGKIIELMGGDPPDPATQPHGKEETIANFDDDGDPGTPPSPQRNEEIHSEGMTAVARYSQEHNGDFTGLPRRESGDGAMVIGAPVNSGLGPHDEVYYDPNTGELFVA